MSSLTELKLPLAETNPITFELIESKTDTSVTIKFATFLTKLDTLDSLGPGQFPHYKAFWDFGDGFFKKELSCSLAEMRCAVKSNSR